MASKGIRYKEEQIIRILKEVESGMTVAEVCRKYGALHDDGEVKL